MKDAKYTKLCFFTVALILAVVTTLLWSTYAPAKTSKSARKDSKMSDKVIKTDKQWKKQLTPLQYKITRKKTTEPPFTGKYHNHKATGIYKCVCCGNKLFDSEAKFHSGTGWPSFYDTISLSRIRKIPDNSLFMKRTEVVCSRCDAHLGHVFKDGPPLTGLRYCLNSAALDFVNETEKHEKAAFAAGCFWSVEAAFAELKGVVFTTVGYSGGKLEDPTYKKVCSGKTGHAETVEVIFDPKTISYKKLLDVFWRIHNPTTLNRQGPDRGTQYRSVIFFENGRQFSEAEESKKRHQAKLKNPIVTEIIPAAKFYKAEEYHQKYLQKTGVRSCRF